MKCCLSSDKEDCLWPGHRLGVDNAGLRGCPVRRGEVRAVLCDSWCRQLQANGDRLGEGEHCLLLFYRVRATVTPQPAATT